MQMKCMRESTPLIDWQTVVTHIHCGGGGAQFARKRFVEMKLRVERLEERKLLAHAGSAHLPAIHKSSQTVTPAAAVSDVSGTGSVIGGIDYGLVGPIGPQPGVVAGPGMIVVSPADPNLQTEIDNAPAGATIFFNAGIYNDLSIQPKDSQTYIGAYGAILTSNTQVHAFFGSGTNVTIKNLVVDGYETGSQQFSVEGGDGWHVDHDEVRNSTAEGILVGAQGTITNDYVHDNGQMGIAAIGTGVIVFNSRVSHNNPQDKFDTYWEAGGSKFWDVNGLLIVHCEFDNNVGNGIWNDGSLAGGGETNTYIYDNWIHDNTQYGVMHEISGSTWIVQNLVENNGHSDGAGIQLDNSESTVIAANIVRNNYNGIVLLSYPRTDTTHTIKNDVVANNSIIETEGVTGVIYYGAIQKLVTATFIGNTYTMSGSAAFAWNGSWSLDHDQWQALGND